MTGWDMCMCGLGRVGVGPRHEYIPASAGCWEALGLVQAGEMMQFGYPVAHALVVDAYMASHPGDGKDRRDRQSVAVHLVGLSVFARGVAESQRLEVIRRVLRDQGEFSALERPGNFGEYTILDMVEGDLEAWSSGEVGMSEEEYTRRAERWARSVWEAWQLEHEQVESWIAGAKDFS